MAYSKENMTDHIGFMKTHRKDLHHTANQIYREAQGAPQEMSQRVQRTADLVLAALLALDYLIAEEEMILVRMPDGT